MSEGSSTDVLAKTQGSDSRLRRYVPLVLWMGVIFFASTGEFSSSNTAILIQPLRWLFPHMSDERLAFIHFLLRKAGHFTEYAILALFAARTFIGSSHEFLRRRWLVAALILISLYSLSDEYHQSFVASRTASIYDSMIDTIGGLTALIFIALWRAKRGRNEDESTATDPALYAAE
jgi:VanZ family protein